MDQIASNDIFERLFWSVLLRSFRILAALVSIRHDLSVCGYGSRTELGQSNLRALNTPIIICIG